MNQNYQTKAPVLAMLTTAAALSSCSQQPLYINEIVDAAAIADSIGLGSNSDRLEQTLGPLHGSTTLEAHSSSSTMKGDRLTVFLGPFTTENGTFLLTAEDNITPVYPGTISSPRPDGVLDYACLEKADYDSLSNDSPCFEKVAEYNSILGLRLEFPVPLARVGQELLDLGDRRLAQEQREREGMSRLTADLVKDGLKHHDL
ncbi:hypothetical protein HYW21_01565 [Candidatus Woesearchaeota archaeon]|nr:hypothetical protein [Candidatus Woesearchaeota archaeon]